MPWAAPSRNAAHVAFGARVGLVWDALARAQSKSMNTLGAGSREALSQFSVGQGLNNRRHRRTAGTGGRQTDTYVCTRMEEEIRVHYYSHGDRSELDASVREPQTLHSSLMLALEHRRNI